VRLKLACLIDATLARREQKFIEKSKGKMEDPITMLRQRQ
jgi:hypothetical protein